MGSHDELMAAGGLYPDLFNLQADRYGLRAELTRDRETKTTPEPRPGAVRRSARQLVAAAATTGAAAEVSAVEVEVRAESPG